MLRNHPGSVNPIIKSNNLLNNALAMQAANRRGGEEALMCNYRGELSECSQSNFFLVRGGVALTPKSQAGLLEGITRAFLFEVGRDAGIEVRDETLLPADLETRRRGVHHQHHPRAEPRRQDRRPGHRRRRPGTGDAEAAERISSESAGVDRRSGVVPADWIERDRSGPARLRSPTYTGETVPSSTYSSIGGHAQIRFLSP